MTADMKAACALQLDYQGETTLGTIGITGGSPLYAIPQALPRANFPADPIDATASAEAPSPRPDAPAPSKPSPLVTVTPSPSPSCDPINTAADDWQLVNSAIVGYVAGVGAVAGLSVEVSSSKYATLADKLAATKIVSEPVAEAAGALFSAIGNEILKQQKQRDVEKIIALSQRHNVLNTVLQSARDNARSYEYVLVGAKDAVDARFGYTIEVETNRLIDLNQRIGNVPSTTAPSTLGATPPATRAPFPSRPCDARCRRLAAHAVELRMTIAAQRAKWETLDATLVTAHNRIAPYIMLMNHIQQVNERLVTNPHGLAGAAATIGPIVSDLGTDLSNLEMAISATPSAKPTAAANKKP